MSKFISKQSVAIWYGLTALLATFLVGQVILTISRYLVWIDCPPSYLSSRASDPLVFSRWEEYGGLATVYPNELDSHDCGGCFFSGVE